MADDAPTDACAQVQALLPAHALGDLTAPEDAMVDEHLAACARCRAELDALHAVVADVGGLAPTVEPGPAMVDRLLAGRPGAAPPAAAPGPLSAQGEEDASARAANLRPIVDDIRRSGITTVRGIAEELNRRGILTPRGGKWHPTSTTRLLARLGG